METEGNFNFRWAEHSSLLPGCQHRNKENRRVDGIFNTSLSFVSRGFSVVFLLNI